MVWIGYVRDNVSMPFNDNKMSPTYRRRQWLDAAPPPRIGVHGDVTDTSAAHKQNHFAYADRSFIMVIGLPEYCRAVVRAPSITADRLFLV